MVATVTADELEQPSSAAVWAAHPRAQRLAPQHRHLEQLADEVQALAAQLDRELVLIAESDGNDPRLVTSREAGGYGLAGQWSDDFHHTDPGLAKAVADGRRAEFAAFGWGAADIPDPQDEATFLRSKLDWSERDRADHRELLAWYRELIALRRRWPELTDPRLDRVHVDFDEDGRWLVVTRGQLRIAANLGPAAAALPLGQSGAELLAASCAGAAIGSDTVTMPATAFAIVRT
jgi:1,4-alpha-glucan branching enzyme